MKAVRLILLCIVVLASCSDKKHDNSHTDYVQDSHNLMLTNTEILLGNIKLHRVASERIRESVVVNGRLAVDEGNTQIVSSRAPGRIEKLMVKETGRSVRRGQPLYELYSETLLTLQEEYLIARDQERIPGGNRSLLKAAENKLLRYGLTRSQIAQLGQKSSPEPRTTFVSPADGIVTEVIASEGQYVDEGTALYKTEDISTLWVEAELYAEETKHVNIGDSVKVAIDGATSTVNGRVIFVSPEFRNGSQVIAIRASIDNPEHRYKPGQHAQVMLARTPRRAVVVPTNAVIRHEHGSDVYLRAGNNTFRRVSVETGAEDAGQIEITRGLNEGDTVVTSGAYLLHSAFTIRGK